MNLWKKTCNKFTSVSLALLMLIGIGKVTNIDVNAEDTSSLAVSDTQNLESERTEEYFTKQQVIEDINYVIDRVRESHVSCANGVPKEVLEQKDLEIDNLSESISLLEERRIISRILKQLHDAHTTVGISDAMVGERFPFEIEFIDRKCFCRSGDFKDTEIIAINGMKIPDIYENFKRNASYEIEEWPIVLFYRTSRWSSDTLSMAGIEYF